MASSYDIKNLQKLFDQLQPKQQRQALRGAMRRAATTVKRAAIANLRTCVNTTPELEKGVRTMVWKRKAGFRVTVGEKRANKSGKGEAGFYISRHQHNKDGKPRKLPVLRWLDTGTKVRKSKTKTRFRVGSDKWRMGKNHGFLKKYAFMDKTKNQVAPTITKTVQDEVITNVQRIAKRYGCS